MAGAARGRQSPVARLARRGRRGSHRWRPRRDDAAIDRASRRRRRGAALVLASGRQHRGRLRAQPAAAARGIHAERINHERTSSGPRIRGPVVAKAAGVHRGGGGDAGDRHRRDRRDTVADPGGAVQAAAIPGSRTADAGPPAVAGPRRPRRATADDLVVSQVPGVPRSPAGLRGDVDLHRVAVEPHRCRRPRTDRRRAGRRRLLAAARRVTAARPVIFVGGDPRPELAAAGRHRTPLLGRPVGTRSGGAWPIDRTQWRALHDHRHLAGRVPRSHRSE